MSAQIGRARTSWRAGDLYTASNASKTGLTEETRQFLSSYARLGDLEAVRRELANGGLPQRSRATRVTIVRMLQVRLTRWQPPSWVLDDLVRFARETSAALQSALLLHVARQDALMYDFIQDVLWPRWNSGEREVARSDVQRFLDSSAHAHPEVESWSHETREKLTGNILSIMRDYGVLSGAVKKTIVEPTVPEPVVRHLERLLQEEGVSAPDIPQHPDWHIWLWDAARVKTALSRSEVLAL
ncbi:MAG TPA: BrxA family protein [Chloroflexia bacterium]